MILLFFHILAWKNMWFCPWDDTCCIRNNTYISKNTWRTYEYISARIYEYRFIYSTQAELWTLFLTNHWIKAYFLFKILTSCVISVSYLEPTTLLATKHEGETTGQIFFSTQNESIYSFWTELPVVPGKFRGKISLWVPK